MFQAGKNGVLCGAREIFELTSNSGYSMTFIFVHCIPIVFVIAQVQSMLLHMLRIYSCM
jgi:hypothetical protein